jgi:hypothetical protein
MMICWQQADHKEGRRHGLGCSCPLQGLLYMMLQVHVTQATMPCQVLKGREALQKVNCLEEINGWGRPHRRLQQ